jgi:hypothetical protein
LETRSEVNTVLGKGKRRREEKPTISIWKGLGIAKR